MPDRLFEFVNPWTTPATLVVGVVLVAWACRARGRTLAAIALSAAIGVALWQAWSAGPPSGLLDLQIYVNSARSWVEGGSIYGYRDPVFNLSATYPPIGPLLFSLMTPFTADGREVIFTVISLAALFGCAWSVSGLARIAEDRRFEWSAWAFALAAVTIPVWLTLRQGQINIVIWLLVLADLESLRRSRRWAGAGIGLATALKLVPGLFAIWLVLTRRWTAAAVAFIAFTGATAFGWLLAPDDSRRYWTDLVWQSERVGSVEDDRNNAVLGFIARVLEPGPARTGLWVASIAIILTIAGIRSLRASRANDLLAVAAIVGCATSAVSPISWTHHLGFLLVALAAFVLQARTTQAKVLCAVAWLVLVDPGGHGDDPLMSTLRGILVIAAIAFTPIRKSGIGPTPDRSQTETTPNSRATNSALPS